MTIMVPDPTRWEALHPDIPYDPTAFIDVAFGLEAAHRKAGYRLPREISRAEYDRLDPSAQLLLLEQAQTDGIDLKFFT